MPTRHDRNADLPCHLDICIPVYRTDPTGLVSALARQNGARQAGLRILDDGSQDLALTRAITRALAGYPGPSTLLTAIENRGRAEARNALLNAAESDWILLLDSDMRVDDTAFLQTYRDAARAQDGPCCIVGGFTIDPALVTRQTRLHARQSILSECLPAATRATDSGRYVFTSNIFLHRAILGQVPFDAGFTGWGWEDVDWGLRLASRFAVIHIDNPAVHLGLDTAPMLLAKYGQSGANFLRLAQRQPQAVARMRLYHWARSLSRLPGVSVAQALAARAAQAGFLPLRLRLLALKLYRAAAYGKAMRHAGD